MFCCTEQVIGGLDRAVSTMLKGELSELTIEPEYAFGNGEAKRDVIIIPSSSTLIYVVELLDFTKVTILTSWRSHFVFLQKLKVEKPQGDEWEGSAEVEASNLENYMVMITSR
ncbi:hypothetical protein GW17_00051412 [Ensete ventricosum]|nr:hypothetical protein GW17_00051412 [Ensete ventricosum]